MGSESAYHEICKRIEFISNEAGRAVPTLLAVSKGKPIQAIEALYRQGHRDFAENYVQELLEKARQADLMGLNSIRWHMIGHLQRNKVKAVLPHLASIHSVDSIELAKEIDKRYSALGNANRLPIFIQVNIDREPTKSGFSPEELLTAIQSFGEFTSIEVQGLMAIPDPQNGDQSFIHLVELEKRCRPITQGNLSMGMSSDFEAAIRAGATHVRIGTALFGPR